ncbi:MAG: zinc metalloprotease [Legionella sp.]|nr:MAG: zinc metalloprotease [Legionella sp.]
MKRITNSSVIQTDEFEFTLTRKAIKRINLRIHADARIHISAPLKCPINTIQHFLEDKKDWIIKHRTRLLATPIQPEPQFHSGALHLFLGQRYPLIIHEHMAQQKIVLENNHLYCYIKKNASADTIQSMLQVWYREQLSQLLPQLIQKWEPIIGVTVHQWSIRAMTTRWGSCHVTRKKICINLHLIQKPLSCLDYVVVHEMVHLLEASHNKRFYTLMTQFMPEWALYKEQLRGRSV